MLVYVACGSSSSISQLFCYNFADEMECEALFAESDDDGDVLQPSSDPLLAATYPKQPISSSFVDSSSPPADLGLPLSHPMSSHTPVPEEYHPLPDSSTVPDPALAPTAEGRRIIGNRRTADLNIRYQPKPRGYMYPQAYQHQLGMRPSGEYLMGSHYPGNNLTVLGDDRNYLQHPMAYAMARHPRVGEDPSLAGYQHYHLHNRGPIDPHGYIYPGNNIHHHHHHHLAPERPSRKLNISPWRRQSKDQDPSNAIEVSSEEEDANRTPKRRQCHQIAQQIKREPNASVEAATIGTSSNETSGPSRVEVKREVQDSNRGSTADSGDADPAQHVCHHLASHPPSSAQNECIYNPSIKQEYICEHNHSNSCSNRALHNCGHYRETQCNSSSIQQPPHIYLACNKNIANATASTSNVVKVEPQSVPVKQEPSNTPNVVENTVQSNAQTSEDSRVQTNPIKVETNEVEIKVEPSVSNGKSCEGNTSSSVAVKVEGSVARRLEEGGSRGDQGHQASPQPGPSNSNNANETVPATKCDKVCWSPLYAS